MMLLDLIPVGLAAWAVRLLCDACRPDAKPCWLENTIILDGGRTP